MGGSNLVLSLHLIPESGSCDNSVLGEDSNSVESWLWDCLSRKGSTDNPILSNLQFLKHNDEYSEEYSALLTPCCMDATPTPLTILMKNEIINKQFTEPNFNISSNTLSTHTRNQ